ncbi:MAG: UDP-N-acetylmuramoyl-L-alanyl-D-glutamate--2,6-diaminopimelate ligase [Alphaproteobacteria bacterium]
MILKDLIEPETGVTVLSRRSGPTDDAALHVPIAGITADSRQVNTGFIFAALSGTQTDGLRYVPAALERGAAAILVASDRDLASDLLEAISIPVLTASEPRKALARLAARLLPGRPDVIAAVTGTNGKTSVATFLRQIWAGLGHKAASMGTLGVVTPNGPMPLAHTTPDPVRLHQILKALYDTGTTHLVLEASSHGLAQDRLEAVEVQAAGFTNLTRDHLDYHGTEEAYKASKARLFTERLAPRGTAVINRAGAHAAHFEAAAREAGHPIMSVGTGEADLALRAVEPTARGLDLDMAFGGEGAQASVPLFGTFQAENVQVALGLALALGADFQQAVDQLGALDGATGRMERVAETGRGAPIFVDYAHTPDALARVLGALRPHVRGRLSVVFGCGGDRDRGKRPQMGAVAAERADRVIVTDDNPRSEDPAAIRRDILAASEGAVDIGDRAEAIAAGLEGLERGDVLVVAGKGHETGQIVGDTVLPFNDADVIREIVGGRRRRHG